MTVWKRQNSLNASLALSGLNYGEHGIDAARMVQEVDRLCASCCNCFIIRPNHTPLSDDTFLNLARYAAKNSVYFGVLYAYQYPPPGKRSHFNAALIKSIRRIAGQYFLGEFMGEAGSDRGAKARGYFVPDSVEPALQMPPQNFEDMSCAKENYVRFIRSMTAYNESIGLNQTLLVEATAFSRYNMEGGVVTPVLEVLPGNPETLIPFTRGAAIGYQRSMWGGFIASEWYGGYRHEDELKAKRLLLAYRYLFITGANIVLLESGNAELKSYGYDLPYQSIECAAYREAVADYYRLIRTHRRAACGPKTSVAFIHGNLDGYTGFMGSSVWSQFDREEWGASSAEESWRILDEVYRSRDWYDAAGFAGKCQADLSGAPAYGMYDVIPIEAPLAVLQCYDMLIFVGWNTMTERQYDKLIAYVENGGHVVIGACHFNTSAKREDVGENSKTLRGGKISSLAGADVVSAFRTNDGVKFMRNSEDDTVLYPGTANFCCDCNYPSRYANYAAVRLTTGKVKCFFADRFQAPEDLSAVRPVLIENRLGKGLVSFFTALDYAGDNGVYSVYRTVVKEYLTATHRACPVKVYGNDRVRFSLFHEEDGSNKQLFLLNTDFNAQASVVVEYAGKRKTHTAAPLALVRIDLDEWEERR